jgi:hypothetical protein
METAVSLPKTAHRRRFDRSHFACSSAMPTLTQFAFLPVRGTVHAQEFHTKELTIRLRISKLEAPLEVYEFEIAALKREINSHLISQQSKETALNRCEGLLNENSTSKAQLEGMRKMFPGAARL